MNDAPESKAIDRVLIELDFHGEDGTSGRTVRFESRDRLEIDGGSGLLIDEVSVELDAPPRSLRLTCEAGGQVVARNSYDLTVYLPPPQPFAARLLRRVADATLGNG